MSDTAWWAGVALLAVLVLVAGGMTARVLSAASRSSAEQLDSLFDRLPLVGPVPISSHWRRLTRSNGWVQLLAGVVQSLCCVLMFDVSFPIDPLLGLLVFGCSGAIAVLAVAAFVAIRVQERRVVRAAAVGTLVATAAGIALRGADGRDHPLSPKNGFPVDVPALLAGLEGGAAHG